MHNHNLEVEKIMDRLGSKYEVVVRISSIAKKMADGESEEVPSNKKVTIEALKSYLTQNPESGE